MLPRAKTVMVATAEVCTEAAASTVTAGYCYTRMQRGRAADDDMLDLQHVDGEFQHRQAIGVDVVDERVLEHAGASSEVREGGGF